MSLFIHCSGIIHVLFMRSTVTLYKKNIKNGFHDTIHIFKNYFVTVFSVFNFQFSVLTTITSIQTYPRYSI